LPLVARVGFAVEYLTCVAVVCLASVLVIGTLLGEEQATTGRSRLTADDD
jgi:hypothetical protein